MTETPKEPIFGDIPPLVLSLCAVILAFSAAVILAPPPLSNWLVGSMAVQIGALQLNQPIGPYPPYVLHVFVHGGWLHLGMNLLGLLAFSTPVARWLIVGWGRTRGAAAFLGVFFLTAIAGAVSESLYVLVSTHSDAVLVGASGGLMGLIGVLLRLGYGRAAYPLPLFSRPVLTGLVPWIVINLIIAAFGAPGFGGQIAWAAHLGGLFAGLLLAGIIAPKR